MHNSFQLKEVDGKEIISLIDNSVDFNSTNQKKEVHKVRDWIRNKKGTDWTKKYFRLPFAEHGFSILIKVQSKGNYHTILFDTGQSPKGVIINAKRMGIELRNIEYIVLSHGHYDHSGGLVNISKIINNKNLRIITHDDMFKIRGIINQDGSIRKLPRFPSENQVAPMRYINTKHPTLFLNNMLLVSGEIPRKTNFEEGFSEHVEWFNGKWVPDPLIWDDRAIIFNIKEKGLVVLSGCAHAGIINTILFAQQITGVKKIYALMGGFHLTGKDWKPRIKQTIYNLQQIKPKIIVPMHCTGWRGKNAIFNSMPHSFICNSVGNLFRI